MSKKSFLANSMILSALIFISSCNFGNPVSQTNSNADKKATIAPKKPIIESGLPQKILDGIIFDLANGKLTVPGNILDAATGKPVTKKVILTIDGKDKDKVEKVNTTFNSGLVGFNLKQGIKPNQNQPLKLTVVAHADGYFSSSVQLELRDEKPDNFIIKLSDIKNTPKGVVANENIVGQTDASGALNDNFSVKLNEPQTNTGISVNLPAGAVITDKNGQPLTGNIKASVGYFSNQSDSSLSAFPGGFSSSVNINGKEENGYFVTGGFTSVELSDGSGKQAAKFDKPMEISMQLPQNTINPDTNQLVKSGEKIGIWSYATDSGKWTSEGEGIVKVDASGNLSVNYSVSHLSYWNLDWHYGTICNPKLRLIWDSDNHIPVNVEIKFEGQYWNANNILSDEINDLYNVPNDRELTITAFYKGKEVGKTVVTLGEACNEIRLNINTQNLAKPKKFPIYLGLKAKSKLTRADFEYLAGRFSLSDFQKMILLNYTHPNNPEALFELTEKAVQEIEALGVTKIREIQALLAQKVRPSNVYFTYIENDDYSTYSYATFDAGKTIINAYEGNKYSCWIYFSYNGRWYYFFREFTVNNIDSYEFEFEDIELIVDILQEYLTKNNINLGGQ